MAVTTQTVKAKDLGKTIEEIKDKGGYILAVTPSKFKLSGKEKYTLTATEYVISNK